MLNAFVLSFYGIIAIALGFSCNETEDHCFTSLDIRYASTMNENKAGQVYAKNGKLYSQETNVPVQIDNVISADGWNLTRNLITANGTMPGPTIFLYQKQTITILVTNRLINETVTIHWHGIDQLAHPAMDGVAYLSQCPILPGHSFNYTFQPRFGGSYWYHSHVGIQRDMGLYGAFIVLRKRVSEQASTNHIIQIQEWNHLYDAITLYLDENADDTPHSILINGRGQFKDILVPIETFYVRNGNRYVFRLIGVGSHRTLLFSIPGLKLTVFETDGFEIVPSVVDKIIIFPAERYDFELDLSSAKEKIYNITVSVLSSPNLTIGNDIGLGFLNVTTENSFSSEIENLGTTFLVLNCPFQTYPHREDLICIPLTDLKARKNAEDDYLHKEIIKTTNETSLHFLNFGFPDDISSINGHSFRWPTVASLSQPSETNTSCNECDEEKTCKCSYSLNLKSGSEVIMVLSTLGQGATISHPIHMHGHTFEVLKMVFPEVTDDFKFVFTNDIKCSETRSNSQSQCNNARWRHASWNNYKNIPGINLNDPIRKDTIVVPYGGYIIIRINATNPGVWFLHCHIDKHMAEGMAVMLNESFEHQHIYIPKGFPTCHSYLKTPSGVISEVSEDEEISYTDFVSTTQSSSTDTSHGADDERKPSSENLGLVAGIVVIGIVFFAIVIFVLIVTVCRKRKRKRKGKNETKNKDGFNNKTLAELSIQNSNDDTKSSTQTNRKELYDNQLFEKDENREVTTVSPTFRSSDESQESKQTNQSKSKKESIMLKV